MEHFLTQQMFMEHTCFMIPYLPNKVSTTRSVSQQTECSYKNSQLTAFNYDQMC